MTDLPLNDLSLNDPSTPSATGRAPTPARAAPARREGGTERRAFTLRTLRCALLAPRRFTARRTEDRRYPLLDRYENGMLALAVALVGLSVLDATFTLMILAAGGTEANPFMNYLLGHGVAPFVAVKMALSAVPAVLLVAAGNLKMFGVLRARSALAALVGMYGGLIVYELALLSLI